MSYWENLKIKLQYSGLIRIFLDALGCLGLRITPYYVIMEGIFEKHSTDVMSDFEQYEVGFLKSDDMQIIAAIPDRNESEEDLLERLKDGQLCFGVKRNDDLSAFTWCNLKEFRVFGVRRAMAQDEAYLFDAYTLLPYRGKGIAPFMRFELYKVLDKLNKKKLYSYSDVFNRSALKFKKKLDARILELNIYLDILRRYRFNFTIKKFSEK